MHKSVKYLTKHKLFPVFLATLISRIVWCPFFFSLSGSEFLPTAIINACLIPVDLLLVILHKKMSLKSAITTYVLFLEFFCIAQALTTQIVCGMELCLYACIPGLFLFTTDKRIKKSYFYYMDTILIAGIGLILYIKLRKLPPQQMFLPERRNFMIISEVFYTSIVLAFLLYGCIITDLTLRKNNTKNEYLQAKLDYVAKHDPLTGLMNRHRTNQVFNDVLNAKIKNDTNYAVAIFDIDDFKKINDTWGHDAGDYILKTFTKRVWDLLKEPVRIGRWGGEEFVIVFPTVDENTTYLLEDVRTKITAEPVVYNGQEIPVTATFGISSSRNFTVPSDVLNDADDMLYIGKQNGKNRLVVSPKF